MNLKNIKVILIIKIRTNIKINIEILMLEQPQFLNFNQFFLNCP